MKSNNFEYSHLNEIASCKVFNNAILAKHSHLCMYPLPTTKPFRSDLIQECTGYKLCGLKYCPI